MKETNKKDSNLPLDKKKGTKRGGKNLDDRKGKKKNLTVSEDELGHYEKKGTTICLFLCRML